MLPASASKTTHGIRGIDQVSLEVAEQGLAAAREAMQETLRNGDGPGMTSVPRISRCPFANPDALFSSRPSADAGAAPSAEAAAPLAWTEDAEARLAQVPEGFLPRHDAARPRRPSPGNLPPRESTPVSSTR